MMYLNVEGATRAARDVPHAQFDLMISIEDDETFAL